MIFGREPAVILAFVAAIVKLLGYEFDVSAGMQTTINTVASTLVALILVYTLRSGALYAALVNFMQAGMALFVGLGLDWSADKQALVMASVTALLAILGVRPQVQAPVAEVAVEARSPYDKAAG